MTASPAPQKPRRSRIARSKPAHKTRPARPTTRLRLPKVGERYVGVKDGVTMHYLATAKGTGADPLVAFFIVNRNGRAGGTRFATTLIRWSLFCRVYKARLFPLAENVLRSLEQSPAQRARLVGSRT
jgi:hypothetical protein